MRYVVPQQIRIENLEKEVDLMLRVTDPCKNKWLVARSGETIIKKAKKAHLTPGEMAKFPDGHEEEHKIIKAKDPADIKNLADWILSQ